LPQLLSEANGALAAQGLAEAALDALSEPLLVGAAWDDVRLAFETGESAGTCELRIKQLAELVDRRGGDWRSTALRLNRVLFDDRLALAELGAIDLADSNAPDSHASVAPAGVALDERLRLVREALAAEPPVGDMVGWVCFQNAFLQSVYLTVCGVEFFGHQLWPEAIASGYPDRACSRREFDDDWHKFFFDSMPGEPFVLACIPLGKGRLTGAAERARSVAQDFVRAAQPHSEWVLVKGAAIYVHGDGWFGDPIDARTHPTHNRFSAHYEPTGRALATLEPALAQKLLSIDPQAHDAVRDVEWAEALSRVIDTPQRLALSTRLVERALPALADEHWTKPVCRYLKARWVEQQARNLIFDTGTGAIELLDSIMSSDRIDKDWRQRLLPSADGAHYTIRLDEILKSVRELVEDLPDGSLQRRLAAELAGHAASGAAWLKLLGRLDRTFDILLARLVRQRNAVLHGADTVPAVVSSVTNFALDLQQLVVLEQLCAAAHDEPLLTALESHRIRLERIRVRLQAGASPATAMFETTGKPAHGNSPT
jgi:hypothetical protein